MATHTHQNLSACKIVGLALAANSTFMVYMAAKHLEGVNAQEYFLGLGQRVVKLAAHAAIPNWGIA